MSLVRTPGLLRLSLPLAVWALHFVAIYSLQGLACARALWRAPWAGLEAMTWVLWGLTAVALVAIVASAIPAYRAWRALRADPDGRADTVRQRFLHALAALCALIATIGVVFTAVPVALLPTCA